MLRHQAFELANKPVGVLVPAGRRWGGAETAIIAAWLPFVRTGRSVAGGPFTTSAEPVHK